MLKLGFENLNSVSNSDAAVSWRKLRSENFNLDYNNEIALKFGFENSNSDSTNDAAI